ncbi:hypothetical protein Tco_0286319, partial [Tanacetum coccineum]
MSTSNNSNNSNQQTLADSGANERPPMLEKGNYIPWESRFRSPADQILEPLSKMTEGNKKKYISDVRVMNYLLQAIPNDIYNSVDACKNAKEMLTTLVNIMDHNNVLPITVAINTKFINYLQPEWSKYVTMVRHNQTANAVSYDVLYDSLVQFEPHVLASRAKKAAKNHDPLALVAHSHASSSHSHANSSYSPQSYYVTHPSSVVDYDDEYQGELQGDSQEGKLTTAMMLLARAISQKFSSPTNNRNGSDKSNKIVQRIPPTDSTLSKENGQCYNCNERVHYACECQKIKVRDAKYFREQMLLAMKDEAGSHLSNEENEFMLDNAYGEESLEELTATVNDSSKTHDQVSHVKCKTIIQTMDDDQIDSSIIFDDLFVENNGCTSEHDSNAHDKYHEIQMLVYNVQREAENKKCLNNELKKQRDLLQQELEMFKDQVKSFESKTVQCSKYKETCDDLERGLRNDKDTIDRLLNEKDKIQSDYFKIENEKLIIQHETQLAKKIDQGVGSTSGIRACALRNFDLGKMELENSQNNALAKLPILKLGEYEMWEIRIKQYFQIQDYALWEKRFARRMMSKPEVFSSWHSQMNISLPLTSMGRKLFDEEVQEKASTDTELFIQEVTPTEVIQDQEGSEKASDEVSTAGAKKDTTTKEVPIISTAGGTVTYVRRSAEKRSRQDKGKA